MASKAALSREQILELLKAERPDLLSDVDEPEQLSDADLIARLTQALTPISAIMPGGIESSIDIDLDALVQDAGLIYHDHKQVITTRPDGTQGPVWMRLERPMTGADVLSWRIDGQQVTLVTKDGQKVTLEH